MLPFSHLVTGVLCVRLAFGDAFSLPLVAFFALWPDLLDKPLHRFQLTRSSRTYGHTLLGALLTGAVVALVTGWSIHVTAQALLATLSHLLADSFFGYVPLWFPRSKFRPSGLSRFGVRLSWMLEVLSFLTCCTLAATALLKAEGVH